MTSAPKSSKLDSKRWDTINGGASIDSRFLKQTYRRRTRCSVNCLNWPMIDGQHDAVKSLSGHIPRSWLRSSDLLPFYHQYPAACCGDFLFDWSLSFALATVLGMGNHLMG